jgi:hypothetical protein
VPKALGTFWGFPSSHRTRTVVNQTYVSIHCVHRPTRFVAETGR